MTQMKPTLVRMPAELLAKIDAERGDASRALFIRRACERAVTVHYVEAAIEEGGEVKFTGQPITVRAGESVAVRFRGVGSKPSISSDIPIGPVAPKPGSRLKKDRR